jgi:quinol monooxygenase YgiN
MIGIVVRFDVHDGDAGAEFDRLTEAVVAQIRVREPGTLVYTTHRVKGEELARMFYEIYANDAALQAHEDAPHVREFHAAKESLLSRSGEGAAAVDVAGAVRWRSRRPARRRGWNPPSRRPAGSGGLSMTRRGGCCTPSRWSGACRLSGSSPRPRHRQPAGCRTGSLTLTPAAPPASAVRAPTEGLLPDRSTRLIYRRETDQLTGTAAVRRIRADHPVGPPPATSRH